MADLSTKPNLVVSGQIKSIDVMKEYGEKAFKKREFVINVVDGKYDNDWGLCVVQDKCDALDEFNVGEHVDVWYNLKPREYNGRYYNDLQAWLVKHQEGKETVSDAVSAGNQAIVDQVKDSVGGEDSSDSLPF